MYNFRTDLADERTDIYKKNNNITNEIDGVKTTVREEGNIKIIKVNIKKSINFFILLLFNWFYEIIKKRGIFYDEKN